MYSSTNPLATPAKHQLGIGTTLHQQLTSGSEVFCSHGVLHLSTSAPGLADSTTALAVTLHAGQSWRAYSTVWVKISAADTGDAASIASLSITMAQETENRSIPKGNERFLAQALAVLARSLRSFKQA